MRDDAKWNVEWKHSAEHRLESSKQMNWLRIIFQSCAIEFELTGNFIDWISVSDIIFFLFSLCLHSSMSLNLVGLDAALFFISNWWVKIVFDTTKIYSQRVLFSFSFLWKFSCRKTSSRQMHLSVMWKWASLCICTMHAARCSVYYAEISSGCFTNQHMKMTCHDSLHS